MATPNELRVAAMKAHYGAYTGGKVKEDMLWLIDIWWDQRQAHRDRFTDGLPQAEWHEKNCAAMVSVRELETEVTMLRNEIRLRDGE